MRISDWSSDVCSSDLAPKSGHERPLWIGQESRDARQRLFLLGVKDMKDCADQKGVRRFFPVVPTFQRPFGIDQNVGDVLNVADLVVAAPNLQQRIISGRSDVGDRKSTRLNSSH